MRQLPVTIIVAEPKTSNLVAIGQNAEEDILLSQYFHDRLEAEKEMLPEGERFVISEGTHLLETFPGKINSPDVLKQIQAHQVDAIAVFGTSIIKEPLLSTFEGRMINLHLGVSPYYRGSGTNFWALHNEDLHLVGATLHYIDPGIDSGEIICHVSTDIIQNDTPHTIGTRVIREGSETMVRVLQLLEQDKIVSTPQWHPANGVLCRRRDFTAEILRELLARWDDGLVRRFLDRQAKTQIQDAYLIPLPNDATNSQDK